MWTQKMLRDVSNQISLVDKCEPHYKEEFS